MLYIVSSLGLTISNLVSKISCILKLFTNWERVNKNTYHESNFNLIFLQESWENENVNLQHSALCRSIFVKNQPVNFDFPKRTFGQKERLFDPYKSFPWLHYDLEKDEMLCATCVSQEKKINLALSSKKEDAFLSTGCSNWKKALEKFRKHERLHCHLEASTMSVIRKTHEYIGEMFSDILSQEKFENHQILLKILENLRFLCRQGD